MVIALLLATVKVPSAACSVYPVPAGLIAQPLKVAIPPVAAWVEQAKVAPAVPVPLLMLRVTVEVLVVTTLPEESSMVTTGWVGKATPPVELDGCVVKTSFDAAPATVKGELVTEVRAGGRSLERK